MPFLQIPANFREGRRVRSELYSGQMGTIIKVRPPAGLEVEPSYDIAWDDDTGVEKVSQTLLNGSSWTILGEVWSREKTEARRRAYLEAKLRRRTEEARQRHESMPAGSQSVAVAAVSSASFYSPGAFHARNSLAGRFGLSDPDGPKKAAKALRDDLAAAFDGVKFVVHTKGESVEVTWADGPVHITDVTDRYASNPSRAAILDGGGPQAKILVRRELSDSLIVSAIEYVRQVIPGVEECGHRLDAAAFRDSSMRDFYPASGTKYSGLSIGVMVRVLLLRWDDYAMQFIPPGATRALIQENRALFPGDDVEAASERMGAIRWASRENCADTTRFEPNFERQ